MELSSVVLGVENSTRQRLPHYIEELRELCAIDSYSYYKPGLDKVADYLAKRLYGLGMGVSVFEHERWGNDLLGVVHGEGRGKVLLIGHIDTVYPAGIAAERPLRVEGDTIYGPGVCDMKGCVLSAVYAVEALLATGYRSFDELRFLCVSDEEINDNRHSQDIILEACDGCQGVLVLEAARANGDIVSARKGNAWYTLTARGRSAHAGVEPEKGRNAIMELAHQTLQFSSLNGWREGITINAGVFNGGTLPNVVPDYASVRFDVRFLSAQDLMATEARWREMMQQQLVPGVELTLEAEPDLKEPMMRSPGSLELACHAQEIAHWLGFSVQHVLTGGASDGSYPSTLGIPVLDGLGPIGGLDHSPREYLMADSVAPRTALLAGLISTVGA
ncbi:MAG TPA: M20 family metallopeptidase [Ktedonobacteraceae bacterium]|nr:M20 family metallopeptidase [Ktedonobacteraceae bacterium]